MKKSMEHWLNDIDKGKQKYAEKNTSKYHTVLHKSDMERLGIKPEPPQ